MEPPRCSHLREYDQSQSSLGIRFCHCIWKSNGKILISRIKIPSNADLKDCQSVRALKGSWMPNAASPCISAANHCNHQDTIRGFESPDKVLCPLQLSRITLSACTCSIKTLICQIFISEHELQVVSFG